MSLKIESNGKVLSHQWNVVADGDECVIVNINNDVELDVLELVLISDVRQPILRMKVSTREIYLCSHTEKPMFCQLGDSVKYVKGSGKKTYQNTNV